MKAHFIALLTALRDPARAAPDRRHHMAGPSCPDTLAGMPSWLRRDLGLEPAPRRRG